MAKNVQILNKGLTQDSVEEFQPEGSYRFMLNGSLESDIGDRGTVTNKKGNTIVLSMPAGITDPHLNGTCLLPNQDNVLFITGWDGWQEVQIIALHKKNDNYLELIRTNSLDYSFTDQIDCIFKIHNGCDVILYFTDGKSKYKSINLTAVENNTTRYKSLNHTPWIGTSPNTPTVDPAIGIGTYGWLYEQFHLTPPSFHPSIFLHRITNNGNLRIGTYTFFIRLLDDDLNPTNWLVWSNPVTVKHDHYNFNHPEDNQDGYYTDPKISNYTGKSISLMITNLDLSFKHYEIGVMERSLNLNTPSLAYRTGQILIPASGSDIFLFNDVDNFNYKKIDIGMLLTKNRKIDIVHSHTQINNRLILANIKGIVRDWSKFQQAANLIKTEYFTYSKVDIGNLNCITKKHHVVTGPRALDPAYVGVNYNHPEFLSYGMSLMRDEVYALGIIYTFWDGSESPVFHIPGRQKYSNVASTGTVTTDIIAGFDYAQYASLYIKSMSAHVGGDNYDAVRGPSVVSLTAGLGKFDGEVLTVNAHTSGRGTWASNRLTNLTQGDDAGGQYTDEYKYLFGYKNHVTCCFNVPFIQNNCSGGGMQRWQYYNTAIRRKDLALGSAFPADISLAWSKGDEKSDEQGSNPNFRFSGGYKGVPGYFDTGTKYSDAQDCDGVRIFPEGNVRHHRMPDHRIEQIFDKRGHLPINKIIGAASWQWEWEWNQSSETNVMDSNNRNIAYNWTLPDSEQTFQLYPLGLIFHNVTVPDEFRKDVMGYYIVRSDRGSNKTVIDKGFMNVCDTSITAQRWEGHPEEATFRRVEDDFQSLALNEVFANDIFLTPTSKPGHLPGSYGYEPPENSKSPDRGWWNIMEIQTPKSLFNNAVILSADYIKLEATLFGDLFFDSDHYDHMSQYSFFQIFQGNGGWNGGMSVVLNEHKYPRVQSSMNPDRWSFIYNIPISGMAYAEFNNVSRTNSFGGGTVINNESYKQRTLIVKHYQDCKPVFSDGVDGMVLNLHNSNMRSSCDLRYPFQYKPLRKDILYNSSHYLNLTPLPLPVPLPNLIDGSRYSAVYGDYYSWSRAYLNGGGPSVTPRAKFVVPNSPYMYYASLKSSVNPYEDFDSIKYIKMHSYLIPSSTTPGAAQSFPVTGGDTFINRFQYEKGQWSITNDEHISGNNNTWCKFITTTTIGYVESEINSNFRYLKEGDMFRTFPFNQRNAYYGYMSKVNELNGDRSQVNDYMNKQQIVYRYKLDFSSYNTEIPSFQLPTTWDYCSNCQESFPNTLAYSEISLDEQIQDYYKVFLINSSKNIPSYTGSIQNLFVKNSDLYIHTEHNLWKISVAPQTMKTNSDTIEVGQGEFLDKDPIRVFNNKDSFSRGGTVDKYTGVFGGGDYFWLDRNSGSVLSLSETATTVSDNGLGRWFNNNLEVNLDTQFMNLTGKPYPYSGTASNLNAGFIATLDPNYNEYILSKKDYKLTTGVISSMTELLSTNGTTYDVPTVIGNYYYDDRGFYIGSAVGVNVSDKNNLVKPLDFTNPEIAENKSWTISYSLIDKAWVSWHSYLPNWIYNDSYEFYSFITKPGSASNKSIWQHNAGEYQTFYGVKYDFIIDYIYKKESYTDATYDTIEYSSNVWLNSSTNKSSIEVPFVTFDRFFVYNNNQLSNLKDIVVSNLSPYSEMKYDIDESTAHLGRNLWRISRLRDMSVNRLSSTQPKFTSNWGEIDYRSEFTNGGYIDYAINPSIIDLNKEVYQIERLTDKYLGIRLFFNPTADYKITFNLNSGMKRNKI